MRQRIDPSVTFIYDATGPHYVQLQEGWLFHSNGDVKGNSLATALANENSSYATNKERGIRVHFTWKDIAYIDGVSSSPDEPDGVGASSSPRSPG